MEGTKVLRCSCHHDYQDEKYGKGMRVHNLVTAKGKPLGWACTVCTPRRLPADKMAATERNPAFGMGMAVPAPKFRILKQAG